jgi:hypothetical protein
VGIQAEGVTGERPTARPALYSRLSRLKALRWARRSSLGSPEMNGDPTYGPLPPLEQPGKDPPGSLVSARLHFPNLIRQGRGSAYQLHRKEGRIVYGRPSIRCIAK